MVDGNGDGDDGRIGGRGGKAVTDWGWGGLCNF